MRTYKMHYWYEVDSQIVLADRTIKLYEELNEIEGVCRLQVTTHPVRYGFRLGVSFDSTDFSEEEWITLLEETVKKIGAIVGAEISLDEDYYWKEHDHRESGDERNYFWFECYILDKSNPQNQ